jgi:hypothetical protein
VPATQYGAAALIVVASLLALIPRDVRTLRADQLTAPVAGVPDLPAVPLQEAAPALSAAPAGR